VVHVKRLIGAVLAVFVLGVTCVLPFVVHDDTYGEVPIPGSGTVHLPQGDVDVTVLYQRPDDDADGIPLPPLSIRIAGPEGTPPPEVVEGWRMKCATTDCDIQLGIRVVRVAHEGDYRVTIDGEVYGPYQPTLTFGRFVWNDVLLALLALGSVIRLIVLCVLCVFGFAVVLWVMAAVVSLTVTPTPAVSVPTPAEPRTTRSAEQLPPAQELVLPYPDPRGRVGKFIFFVLWCLLLVVAPIAWTYSWFHLPGGAPVSWIPVVVLTCFWAGFGWLLSRVVVRWAVIRRRRRARGLGWLRLSATGFEVHERFGKPHRYEWWEIDWFALVQTSDGEGGFVPQVGMRFSSERPPTRAAKIWDAIPPKRRRDETSVDRRIDGYWVAPLDEAVDVMNAWLMRYRAEQDRESVNRARKLDT
jgi:hypothetical protein